MTESVRSWGGGYNVTAVLRRLRRKPRNAKAIIKDNPVEGSGMAQLIDQFKHLFVGQVCSCAPDEHCGWGQGSRSSWVVLPRFFRGQGNPCGVD